MKILKAGEALGGGVPQAEDLSLISRFSRKELTAEEVYVFPVLLCDNEVDRDLERFDEDTLAELAGLFVGKTGITDHDWRSGNQVARIFRTELVRDPERRTAAGESYIGLKAWAYMLRTEANAARIADIEGGIKKEVSVGVSVREKRCGICGKPLGGDGCVHIPGEEYGGRLCHGVLHGASDAYEWSFVAVPAQPAAGVTKALDPAAKQSAARLEQEAVWGRKYLAELRAEVKRLGLLCGKEFYRAMALGAEQMEPDALVELKSALEKRAAEILPPLPTQLPGSNEIVRFDDSEAFKI